MGYVGAAATKSLIIGLIILATAGFFVPLRDRPSGLDDGLPDSDLHFLQPVRFHYRAVGGQLRKTAAHPAAGHYAAGVSRRQLLLGQHAAARLADRHAVQPGGLPDQWFSLELFRSLRCERGIEPDHGAGVSGGLPARRVVDVQDRVSVEAVGLYKTG